MSTLSKSVPRAAHFTPIKSRLETRLGETSKEEKKRCMETAHEACRLVCNVVASKDRDELLISLVPLDSNTKIPQSCLEGLISTFRK